MPDPSLTCAQLQAPLGYLEQTLSHRLPDGSGYVRTDIRFTHDGVSVRPDCDGPITRLRVANTGTSSAWALLPHKRKAPLWIQIDPGTDVVTTSPGALANIGVETFSDAAGVAFTYTQPV